MFKPAGKVAKKLKIAVYGDPGTGKTWFALQAPGRKAVIDTENGTDFYGEKFDFDVIKTRLYSEVRQAVNHIEQNPSQYDVLIIDPITNIYQVLKDAAQMAAEERAEKYKRNPDDAALTFRDWGIIKNKYSSLISRLCNLPCHVIITGWLKDIYDGEGDKMKKVGTRIDADKKTEYQPDVIIRLEVDNRGTRWGVIEKDRTMTYQKGQRVKDISFNNFLSAVNSTGSISQLQTEEDAAAAEADIKEETLEQIKSLWMELGYKPEVINAQTQKHYGAPLYELTEREGQEFLSKLQEVKQKPPATASNVTELKGKISPQQRSKIFKAGAEKGLKSEDAKKVAYIYTKLDSMTKMTKQQAHDVIEFIEGSTLEELQNYIQSDEMKGAV